MPIVRPCALPWLVVLVLTLVAGCSGTGGESSPPPAGGAPGPGGRGGTPARDASSVGGGGGSNSAGGSGGSGGGSSAADATPAHPLDSSQASDATADSTSVTADVAPEPAPDASSGPDQGPGVSGYNPCPPKGRPCVALPLGDSLTQGAGSSGGGYRRELFRQAVSHGQSVTFVGSGASGPAMLPGVPVPFPRAHEGHGGFNIQGIADLIRQNNTIAGLKPDIVMLQIGVNNGLRRPGANVPAVLNALGALIDQILAADSHLLLIVAQITPNKTDLGVGQIQAFNRGIPALVAARAAAGKHIAIVDIYKFFTANPNWKNDYLPSNDVHPNDAGYDAMGRGWYSALGPLLR
jgi:lysophospholipase L1-like esterase